MGEFSNNAGAFIVVAGIFLNNEFLIRFQSRNVNTMLKHGWSFKNIMKERKDIILLFIFSTAALIIGTLIWSKAGGLWDF